MTHNSTQTRKEGEREKEKEEEEKLKKEGMRIGKRKIRGGGRKGETGGRGWEEGCGGQNIWRTVLCSSAVTSIIILERPHMASPLFMGASKV